jgi:hypothetical protein
MVSVLIRFLSCLLGSLAAFFVAAHLMHSAGYISAYSLERVDEFFRLLVRPVTTLEAAAGKTVMIVAIAIIVQALAIFVLFKRWDRPPSKKAVPVEQSNMDIPDRLHSGHAMKGNHYNDDYESALASESACPAPTHSAGHDCGPSSRAIEAARQLAQRNA